MLVSIEQDSFIKRYLKGWSDKLFVVRHISHNNLRAYKLQDQPGDEIKGTFYAKELQKVTQSDISKTHQKDNLEKRDLARNLFYFVKWKGYSNKFNCSVRRENLKKLMNCFI